MKSEADFMTVLKRLVTAARRRDAEVFGPARGRRDGRPVDHWLEARLIDEAMWVLMVEIVGDRCVYGEEQAARYLGVTTHYLALLRKQKRGPSFADLGGPARYRRAALDEWVRQCERDPSKGDPWAGAPQKADWERE